MKYEDYEAIAGGVTAENAADIVRAMLEKLKTDIVEVDAEIADYKGKLESANEKYKDLQVDYIKKFTSSSAEIDDVSDDDPDEIENEIAKAIVEAY